MIICNDVLERDAHRPAWYDTSPLDAMRRLWYLRYSLMTNTGNSIRVLTIAGMGTIGTFVETYLPTARGNYRINFEIKRVVKNKVPYPWDFSKAHTAAT